MEMAIEQLAILSEQPHAENQLLELLRGLRLVTAQTDVVDRDAFSCLMFHPKTIPRLIAIIRPSVAKSNFEFAEARRLRVEILSEAIWILNNLIADSQCDIEGQLFEKHNIADLMLNHLAENFLEHATQQTVYEEGHYL